MATKSRINDEFAPLSFALLGKGYLHVTVTIAGFQVKGTRLYNARGCPGYAWNPDYQVGTGNNGISGTSGTRAHCVDWIYKHQPK